MEKELIDFLKYVKEVHVDGYGHLEIKLLNCEKSRIEELMRK